MMPTPIVAIDAQWPQSPRLAIPPVEFNKKAASEDAAFSVFP